MKNKNLIRILVLVALFAWPGVEVYRYWLAKRELAASAERLNAVSVKFANLKSVHVADKPAPAKKP
jgi:hypothetical protein